MQTLREGVQEPHERLIPRPGSAPTMSSACLINHYNYGDFIGEAVASVLAQTHLPTEIILVDDGSDADSLAKVRQAAALSDRIRLIEKENGGQLSCFEAGVAACNSDILFFLDADDAWAPTYVEKTLAIFEQKPTIDLVGTNPVEFFPDGREEHEPGPSRCLGFSAVRCLERKGVWMGAATSCLAVRKRIIDRIFPPPNPGAWRVCADEMLVYGSSMAGALMYFQGEPLVRYRVHDNNAFYGTKDTPERAFGRRLEGRRLIEHLRVRFSLPERMPEMVLYEFKTIESPTPREFKDCWRIVTRSSLRWSKKLDLCLRLRRHYRKNRA
ncbi:MAG: glycosyltransferase involved in cell wall biosynthesis [Chlamydiales bacterium]|jgi:glycosyltransferase involved in cell wall biosynthesis